MKKTLLVLAGGMGSRFGGPKQMEAVGPNGQAIIDYSVYDAKKYGFNKVVFIIKEDIKEDFINLVGNRISKNIEVHYVIQPQDSFRKKPWGTAHAILCCKDIVNENFLLINSDDFYGADAFKVASENIDKITDENFALISYGVENTLTENGTVKRGVIWEENGKLIEIKESKVGMENNALMGTLLQTGEKYNIPLDARVSMNMFLFTPKIFEYLEKDFREFLKNSNDLENDEFLIPVVLSKHVQENDVSVDILNTVAKWHGMTYKEDAILVKQAINKMIENGEYKEDLWKKE